MRTEVGKRIQLPALLATFFVLEQFATAIYDWENNPRRAFPLLFAISCACFVVVRAKVHLRWWRIAFIIAAVVSAFLTMSDTLTRSPVVGYMATGEAMRGLHREVLRSDSELDSADYPKLMRDQRPVWWDISPARVTRPFVFVFANLFLGAMVVALLMMLRERALVPRFLPQAVGAILVLSLAVRFL